MAGEDEEEAGAEAEVSGVAVSRVSGAVELPPPQAARVERAARAMRRGMKGMGFPLQSCGGRLPRGLGCRHKGAVLQESKDGLLRGG